MWLAWISASAKGIWLLSPEAEGECVLVLGLMAYTAARELPPTRALLALAGGVATVIIVSVAHHDAFGQWIFPIVIFCGTPWFAGRAVRNRVLYGREMEERAARLEALRDEEEARAVQNERRRIARELHDVVAHSMSVMVIQAGAGRRLAASDPDQAAACAALIEQVGREALGEMRRLVGMISPDEHAPAELAPQPGLDALGELADRARAAGLPVELRVSGAPVALPAGAELAAYRVAQESLTNALKHAGPAHVRVLVTWAEDELRLVVADDGRGPGAAPVPGGGHGLVGMQERVALYGGDVTTGRRRGGGFEVRARFPYVSEPAPG